MAKRKHKDDLLRPLAVYVAVVAVLGVLLAAWQARYEAARRPPSVEAVVRNLKEPELLRRARTAAPKRIIRLIDTFPMVLL